eukprot:3504530-Prymnesium_polylepis.1
MSARTTLYTAYSRSDVRIVWYLVEAPLEARAPLEHYGYPCPANECTAARGPVPQADSPQRARRGGSDLRNSDVLAHNRLALPRSAACV